MHYKQLPGSYDVEGRTKDGCRIFSTYVSRSVNNALCIVRTELSNLCTKISVSYNDMPVMYLAQNIRNSSKTYRFTIEPKMIHTDVTIRRFRSVK